MATRTNTTSRQSSLNDLEHPAAMLANGADLLTELLCKSDGKYTDSQFEHIFYLATKVRHDAAALRDLTIEAVEANFDAPRRAPMGGANV